jgi:peptide methionine sulfoxide reductase MsrB
MAIDFAAENILRRDRTERRSRNPLNDEKAPGTLICAAVTPLCMKQYKFDSGTGWLATTARDRYGRLLNSDMKIGYGGDKCATCGH